MSMTRHSIIRALAGPRPDATGSQQLGFEQLGLPARPHLDRIPRAVVVGFESALESRSVPELANRIDLLEPSLQGFGYEGAVMAWTILDATAGGGRTRDLIQGPARPHVFLAYIGIGFAMRRLPRVLWSKVLPDLDIPLYHPTLSWLAVDGYGFDLAYFKRATYVTQQVQPKPWPWLDRPDYFPRAVDQGIGRALWFVHGGSASLVADAVGEFSGARQRDLWAGVGLAASVAGPYDPQTYRMLIRRAEQHVDQLGVGAVFAARARVSAGFVPEHSRDAVQHLAGLEPYAAAQLADDAAVTEPSAGLPAYERWRRSIADAVTFRTDPLALPNRLVS